jgi:hypothetical protein
MESNRAQHQVNRGLLLRRQSGITVIGLLFLIVVIGGAGLAVVRIVPLYLERMKIHRSLEDVQSELSAGGNTVPGIRSSIEAHFNVDYVSLDREDLDISREGDGYVVRVNKELRSPFVADLWFMVMVDEEVQISK